MKQFVCHTHGKRIGINACMFKVMKTFVCRGCMNPVTSTGCTSVDIWCQCKSGVSG